MSAQDKQPRVLKLSQRQINRKKLARYSFYVLSAALTIILIIFLWQIGHKTLKINRSKDLVSTIHELHSGKHTCYDGLKKVGSIGSKVNTADQYSNDAREAALDYLMTCNFMTGKTKQALDYAMELNKLYIQDKKTSKQLELTQYINYMKAFGR